MPADTVGKPLPAREAARRAEKYLRQVREYEVNARRLFAQGDDPKAGEAAWGAAASGIKALMLVRTGRLIRATEVGRSGARVARALGLLDEYAAAQALHANFYDQFLAHEAFGLQLVKALRYAKAVAEQARAGGGTLFLLELGCALLVVGRDASLGVLALGELPLELRAITCGSPKGCSPT